jgi:glycerol uptake facilitator-like aquaporin
MNPARTIGPNIISELYSSIPFYILSTIIGAWLAAELFLRIGSQEKISDDFKNR